MTKIIWQVGFLLVISLILIGTIIQTKAAPVGVTSITEGSSSRANIDSTQRNVTAQAGNVTEINLTYTRITEYWQGFYGQIAAYIVLADSSNNQFYNWSDITPSGEVFASPNTSITWANIKCLNFSSPGLNHLNLSELESETWFNMSSTASDGINETYNYTSHSEFTVGSVTIASDSCPATYVYGNSGQQATDFENILLQDNESVIFASILEADETGFDGGSYDFELLVAENGHGGAASVYTPYYFWVEIS